MERMVIFKRKHFSLMWIWNVSLLIVILYSCCASSWRISQKCPHGHYYNDGCTACWCDIRTGHTKCEKSLQCSGTTTNEKCPNGRHFKDKCGNDCTCYEFTGAVLCNEVRKCVTQNLIARTSTASPTPASVSINTIIKRSGLTSPYVASASFEQPPITFHMQDSNNSPVIMSSPASMVDDSIGQYGSIGIASTPHPQIRIPSAGHSEELIIEPAIIVRKKGSNKASIVRNPSSATMVTLPSSRKRSQTNLLMNRMDSKTQDTSRTSFSPLHLYEKQMQTIMNIRRAYSQLLRAKVNFNFQIAAGKSPSTASPSLQIPDSQTSSDHPRRFDVDYNSTVFTDIRPTPFPNPFTTPRPIHWKGGVKNVLQQFSPVPPIKQLVSFVSSSTENYLKDFLNKNRMNAYLGSSTFAPPLHPSPLYPTMTPQLALSPSVASYPVQQYSTPDPYSVQQLSPSPTTVSIDHVGSNQGPFTPTQIPPLFSHGQSSYSHKTTDVSQNGNELMMKEHFPHMHNFMRDLARMDTIPSSTPRSIASQTVFPTHTTPGPPYAEIQEVRPLSFAPPPPQQNRRNELQEEGRHPPPTFQSFTEHLNTAAPTVVVNLDKPLYVSPPQAPQLPQLPPVQHNRPFFPQFFPPHSYNNNRKFFGPANRYPPPINFQQPQINNFPPTNQRQPPHPYPPHQHPSPSPYPPNYNPYSQNVPQPPPMYPQNQFHPPPYRQTPNHPQVYYQNMQFPPPHTVHHNPPVYPKYFIPKPKQYRLTLKGSVRDAAVRVDDVVPRFVSRIAHEFFKKPEIYVPKIRPGKPLTLERVILNHKDIVPPEMSFSSKAGESTKLRFTPQAQWEIKEDLAKHGIMTPGPLNPVKDYGSHDHNVMELDKPFRSTQTWETHGPMGMGAMGDDGFHYGTSPTPSYTPILLPSPTPTVPTTMDYQIQQELQHQILLAQNQAANQQSFNSGNSFKLDQSDFNDFKLDDQDPNVLPPELQYPGVKEVVVDKYVVRDPLDPTGALKVYSKTTVQPEVDISSVRNEHRRNGLAALPAHGPTFPPSVLVRHHGAPSPGTTTPPPQQPASPFVATTYRKNDIFVTVISSTPSPFVATTPEAEGNSEQPQLEPNREGIADQIHGFLQEQMDFGARPESNLYEMMFHHRSGQEFGQDDEETVNEYKSEDFKQNDGNIDEQFFSGGQTPAEQPNMDTESVANIFSIDYRNKYNQSPPAVIVIKVPQDESDGTMTKSIDKRKSNEVIYDEMSKSRQPLRSQTDSSISKDSFVTTFSPTTESQDKTESSGESSVEETSAEKRRRERKNRKRKRRRRKKKNRERQQNTFNENVRTESGEENKRRTGESKTSSRRESKSESGVLSKVGLNLKDKAMEVDNSRDKKEDIAAVKFQAEIDWKSKLMANICDINPSSPLCLTYRSICLLMTSED